MKIKEGYLYHIKDDFFELMKDNCLLQNHENNKSRLTYFAFKDKDYIWFIPLSSKVEKYKKIVNNKIKKYGFCNTIMIRKILEIDQAILLQNAFPILEKYVSHVHTANGIPTKVNSALNKEILTNFKRLLCLKEEGINLFFTDIDKIKEILLKEKVNT